MSAADEKKFVMKQVFTGIPKEQYSMNCYDGEKEIHFNIPWRICNVYVKFEHFITHLECMKFRGTDDWSIEAEIEFKIVTNGESVIRKFTHLFTKNTCQRNVYLTWPELESCLIDGNVTVQCEVKINKMTGIRVGKLRNFGESANKFSDVVLVVKNEKFNVLKMYLASHSTYFDTLFFGNFDESDKSEITLKNVDVHDFQNFLEVLHGEPAIDDDTVQGILKLADMYGSETVIRRCEEFFINKSEHSLQIKFSAAIKHNMAKLKEKCFSQMDTHAIFRSLVPIDANEFDPSVWKELFLKVLSLK